MGRMDKTMELLRRAKDGDREAGNALVMDNLGLVGAVVRRFEHRGYDAEELFQIGTVGLIKAVDNFDFSYEVRFSTYAIPVVTGEIRRFLRDDGMVKVSRGVKEKGWQIKKSRERLEQSLGRSVTVSELAQDTGLTPEEVLFTMEAAEPVDSIDQPIFGEDGSQICVLDRLGADSGAEEALLNRVVVQQLLGKLEQQERQLIVLRYFEGLTQQSVAEKLGMTQVQVSRQEKKILRKLRDLYEKKQ
jgi:RNA polymerase sporulation-specific sigma factor